MPTRVLVLPSPLLGPVGYQPLAEALRGRGHAATVAECPVPGRPERLVEHWTRAADGVDLLVAHSNAGYLAPAVGARAGGLTVLFADAALPPAQGPTRLAPAELLPTLEELADDGGRLPPWTRWWPVEEMARLLPAPWFGRVDAAAPRLDLDYFLTEVTPPQEWSTSGCGYLAFGTTYAAELEFARDAGWPTAELPGHHLWLLARPDDVAAALDDLADRLSG